MKNKLLLITLFACGLGWGQIIISQVYEGASNNKWVEITNVGNSSVDLTTPVQYKFGLWSVTGDAGNGSISGTPTSSISLTGSLSAGAKFLIRNTGSSTAVPHNPMPTGDNSNTTVAGYNGNDAIAIFTGTNTIVDAFGHGINNKDISYHRNSNVLSANASFTISEWTSKSLTEVANANSSVSEYIGTHIYNSSISSTTYTTTWSNSSPTASIDAIIDGDLITTTDLVCKDLTINSGKTLTIAAGTTLTVSGNLVNNGSIVFKSNNTSTGRFGPYNGSATSGSVTMERYIDGKRAFRFLAPGVTTTSTIANNWQQQVFITGSATVANAGGFDVTETGAPSMFTFEDSGWTAIANTGLTLNAHKGYRILIRGDRTPSILTSPSNGTMNTPVTLTATGTMVTGNVTYTTLTNQDYTLVANPYISPINWATVTKNNISDTYYAWDPNLGTGNQRGRYVSCDVAGNTSIISGTGSLSTDVDQFIQPGQAVFIQKTTSGVNGSVIIKETDKAATFTDVFRMNANTSADIYGKLGINLYEGLAFSLAEYPIDGAVAVSGATYNTTSSNDDTKKIMSQGEQVAFVRDNIQLGVEKISAPQENDELSIACVNLVPNKNYVWSVVLQDDFSNEDTYLFDAFTQTYHPLTGNSVISFNTTYDVNSSLVNRFKIVFQNALLNTDAFATQVGVYPNPSKGNGFYLQLPSTAQATVKLYNTLGQEIAISNNEGHYQANQSLAAGVYHIMVTQGEKTSKLKWIVE